MICRIVNNVYKTRDEEIVEFLLKTTDICGAKPKSPRMMECFVQKD